MEAWMAWMEATKWQEKKVAKIKKNCRTAHAIPKWPGCAPSQAPKQNKATQK